jgi:ubiquinone/menaquinone biosynthesis C-methylase UbiE
MLRLLLGISLSLSPWATPLLGADDKPAEKNEATDEEIPPGLTHYMGREIAQTMHYLGAPWLTRESREREEDSRTMLKKLELRPGMMVCDLGAGNGFYTLPIAKSIAGEGKEAGKVYAVEIQPQMLRFLRKRAEAAKVENIEYVLGTLVDPKLPAGVMDMILLVDVYHEFSHPEHMLKAMRKSLKPDGVVVLVEFRAEDPKVPIKPEHKMSKEQIKKEWTANGYKLVKEFDELPWQHMMWFKRDEVEKKQDAKEKK